MLVDGQYRAHKQLVLDLDAKTVALQFGAQLATLAAEVLAQGVQDGANLAALAVDDRIHAAQLVTGFGNGKAGAAVFEVLALENAVTVGRCHFDKSKHGVAIAHLLAVVQPRHAEIQRATGRAAHKQVGQLAGFVQRLHQIAFAIGQAIDQRQHKALVVAHGKRQVDAANVVFQLGQAVFVAQAGLAGLDVFARQRHRCHVHIRHQRGVKQLEHHGLPLAIGGQVQGVLTADTAQLACGGGEYHFGLREMARDAAAYLF